MLKALLLTGGQFHPFEECSGSLASFLKEENVADVTVTQDRGALTKGNLSKYDIAIFYTQGGSLTPEQEEAITGFVEGGGGFVGIHCATDSFVENAAYIEMIGGRFADHAPCADFAVRVTDKTHTLTARMEDFWITDELYVLDRTPQGVRVLAQAYSKGKPQPMVYVKTYGKGRVAYLALGHDERAFKHPMFRKLARRAVRWAGGFEETGHIRCGLVGYGGAFNMGKHHGDQIAGTGRMSVAAVCDLSEERLEQAKRDWPGVATFTRLEDMLKGDVVDLVVVITPHNTHAKLCLAALEAGKHVVCEKPFCITTAEADAMIEAARRKNVLLTVFHNRRLDGDFLTIKRIIGEGWIGEPYRLEGFIGGYGFPGDWWRSDKAVSGGAIYDWGAHFFDWILNLMPGEIRSVCGHYQKRVWHTVTNEDECEAVIHYADGRIAQFQISSIAAVPKPKWRILGTRGGIRVEWDNTIEVTTTLAGLKTRMNVECLPGEGHRFYALLADHIFQGEELLITPEAARRVIAVVEAADRSAKSGRPEPLP